MKLKFLFFTLLFSIVVIAQTGTVSGVILDKEFNNEPLAFANVTIKGTTQGSSTDDRGKYSITLKPGNYTLVIAYLGYETKEIPFTLKAGEKKIINHTLEASGVQLKDIVIEYTVSKESEQGLLQEQQKAVEIKQSIGAQEMSRKGISNVEQGVTKISGVTKVADRGIFVRGLDDRYNYLQINGLNVVPSDPSLKTIPLNFIPSDAVRNVDVFKTYNTDLYQDFAGASINVWTKEISNKPETRISISTGINTNTTLKDFKTSDEGGSDFFGYGSKNRSLPSVFSKDNPFGYTATPSESIDLFDASWTPKKTKAPLTIGTNIFNSNSFSLKNNKKIGYMFNVNFSNSYLNQQGKRRNLNSEGFATKDFDRSLFTNKTQKSFLSSINLKKLEKYNFNFNIIYLHNSENTIDEVRGDNTDFITTNRPFFLRDTKFVENTTFSLQQTGNIYFKENKNILDYGVAVSLGKNNLPDRKILITEGEGENADYITFNGADPFRFYSELDNFNVNGKLSYEINWKKDENDKYKNTLKFGYNGDMTSYNFFQRTIRTFGGSSLTNTTINTDDPQVFFDNAFTNGDLSYRSNADPTYKVEINQIINAGFINYRKNWSKLMVEVGLRVEYLLRETKYRTEEMSVNDPFRKLTYDPIDFNPVLNLKYNTSEKSNLRFTASKTSTKPRFREILPFRYSDGDGNFVIGNQNIKNTTNYNADLKYETFPSKSLYFSATVFGKLIENPISRLLTSTSTGYLTTYENFDTATIYGLEFESSIGLSTIFTNSEFAKKINLGVNTSIMKTNEEADKAKFPQLTNNSRSLQGASDFILNTDISYEIKNSEKLESRVNFIFNTFSERIYAVGVEGADDVKEQPINMLDFTCRNTFNKKYQLNLTVKNILDQKFRVTQDATGTIANPSTYSNVNQRLTLGTSISLEFTYTF